MIEIDILRALLLDEEKQAVECIHKHETNNVLNKLSKTKLKNNFANLCRCISNDFQINSKKLNKEYAVRKAFIKNISQKLSKHMVKHVFIKGVPLSNSFYKNPSDRIYTDADILIDLKDYKNFYKFLDANDLKHNFNYKYLSRTGYTRSALEVIESDINLDFHFRISENFKKDRCALADYALTYNSTIDSFPVPKNELLLTICLFNALKKDSLRSGPIYLVDSERIIKNGLDEDYLLPILNEFKLTEFYKNTISIIGNLKKGTETQNQKNFIVSLFRKEGKKSFMPSYNTTLTQIKHFMDPEPYLNYVGGNLEKNHLLELIKNKLKRIKKRI